MKRPQRPAKPRAVIVAERNTTLRDFVVFQIKLALDGLKDLVVMQLSVFAIVVDVVSGRGRKPRWFYSVVHMSERFEQWLNLHGAVERREAGEDEGAQLGTGGVVKRSLREELE